MKRISRSLLSLCLALVLCAALLPVNVAKATGGGTTARAGTSFLITGYRASRSSIYTGDTVDITVYLSRTDGSNDSIRVVRGLDHVFAQAAVRGVQARRVQKHDLAVLVRAYAHDAVARGLGAVGYNGDLLADHGVHQRAFARAR